MTLAEVGRGQSVGQILADLDNPRLDDGVEDDFFVAVRRNLRRHRQSAEERVSARRLARAAEESRSHPIFGDGDDDGFDREAWSQIVD